MGKLFDHIDELGGGVVAYTPDTPQSRIDEEVHMEQRTLGDWELTKHARGGFWDMEWEERTRLMEDKEARGNRLLDNLVEFQGGEHRCFVCQEVMPSAGDKMRLHDYIRDWMKTVGVNLHLPFSEPGFVGVADAAHYVRHGFIDCSTYNGINPTLEMVKVSHCDPNLEGLPFGGG